MNLQVFWTMQISGIITLALAKLSLVVLLQRIALERVGPQAAVLALWIVPVIWSLQMEAHAKSIVYWLFGSRLLICVTDIGRMAVIHKALQSEDHTRKHLIFIPT